MRNFTERAPNQFLALTAETGETSPAKPSLQTWNFGRCVPLDRDSSIHRICSNQGLSLGSPNKTKSHSQSVT
jgi:hypothetical protein